MLKLSSRAILAVALATLVFLPLRGQNNQNQDGQQGGQGGFSVSAVVSDISGSTIKLLNGLVVVDASAKDLVIVGEKNDARLTLASIKAGAVIDVSGTPGAGGKVVASRIVVHGPKPDGEIQGKIESVDLAKSVFSIQGLAITFSDSTLFEGDNEGEDNSSAAFGPKNLAPGMAVDVEVVVFQGKDGLLHLFATVVSTDGGDSNSGSTSENSTARPRIGK